MAKKSTTNKRKTTVKNVRKAVKHAKQHKALATAVVVIAILVIIAVIALQLTGYINVASYIKDFLQTTDSSSNTNSNNGNNSNSTILTPAEGDLLIHVNDVGQGDSILIELPDGKNLLIDGGERFNDIEEDAVSYITDRGIDTLNYILLTHTDSDHCGSLNDIIEAVDNVEKVYFPKIRTSDEAINTQLGLSESVGIAITTAVYRDFVSATLASTYLDGDERKATEYEFLLDEIVIDGSNYRFTMYCVSNVYYNNMNDDSHDINDVSPICVLEYANRKIIFTGDANNSDIDTSAEKRFMDALALKGYSSYDSDILKVAHHGGKDSSGEDFLDFISVEYAIISVGEKSGDNSTGNYSGFVSSDYYNEGYTLTTCGNGAYDHPHRDVAGIPVNGEGRLAQSGVEELYRTDLNGDTVFTISDSGEISVHTAKTATVEGTTVVYLSINFTTQNGKNITLTLYYEDRLRNFEV